jgi:hypothetical protein
MDEKVLPQDLVVFLKDNKQLSYDADECEPGQITLLPFNKLAVGEVYINSEGAPFVDDDPHAGEEGYYSVPAMNLVADCDGYDPEGILIWLPDQQVFGTWDIDHWDVLVFPDVSWTDIVSDPAKYVNAQWEPDDVNCEYLQPFPTYAFKTGKPWDSQ